MMAGVSAPEVLEPIVRDGERVSTARAAEALHELYAQIKRHLGLPDYVPSAESRQLLGSDTPKLRLYQVKARDHGFSDALGKMLQDLDAALRWVEYAEPDIRSAAAASDH